MKEHAVIKNTGKRQWELYESFKYKANDVSLPLFVPKGFVTDFASIPRLFWWIFSPSGEKYDEAALIHDWLYAFQSCTRKEADLLFYICMREYGVGWITANIMYYTVRLFGRTHWEVHVNDRTERKNCLHLLYEATRDPKYIIQTKDATND